MGCESIRKEVQVIDAIQTKLKDDSTCKGKLMTYLDAKPCTFGPLRPDAFETYLDATASKASFVMERMDATLEPYLKREKMHCLEGPEGIVSKVREAIKCMHKAGWAHLDIKAANVLV